MRPDCGGEKAHLTEKISTQGEPSAQAFVEGPQIAHLLPTVKNKGFGSKAVEEVTTSIPSQTETEGGIVDRLHARIGGVNLSPTMLEEKVDGNIERKG